MEGVERLINQKVRGREGEKVSGKIKILTASQPHTFTRSKGNYE